jgi:hypothetical protein
MMIASFADAHLWSGKGLIVSMMTGRDSDEGRGAELPHVLGWPTTPSGRLD